MDEDVCYVNVQFAQLLLVCRVIGAAPVHLTRVSRGYMVTLSRNYAIYNTVFISIISASLGISQFLLIYFINNELEPSILSFIIAITIFWDMFSQNFPLFITIYKCRKRFSRIIKYLRKINEINAALDSEYITIKLKRTAVIFWLISTLISFVLFMTFLYYNEITIISNNYFVKISLLLYYFNIMFVLIIELQYIYILCLIRSTTNTFNRRLKYYFTEAPLGFRSIAAVRANTIHLFRVYVSLCDLIADFNNDEGAIILSFVLFHISNIITSKIRSYFTYYATDPTELNVWLKLLILVYECMRFIVFVEACHRVKIEDVRHLVSAHAHLKCFEMNMQLHDPVISPLGLFDIIRTFIQMILGGIVTLVTFLILVHGKVE